MRSLTYQEHCERCEAILARMTYQPHTGFRLDCERGVVLLSHWQIRPDVNTGDVVEHRSRKWYLSLHMTDEEVIRTFALCVKIYSEHEVNEWLRYDGKRILDPHPEGPRQDFRFGIPLESNP